MFYSILHSLNDVIDCLHSVSAVAVKQMLANRSEQVVLPERQIGESKLHKR